MKGKKLGRKTKMKKKKLGRLAHSPPVCCARAVL